MNCFQQPSIHLVWLSLIFATFGSAAGLAQNIRVGKGAYRTDLPALNQDGEPNRRVSVNPLVSAEFTGAIPTNDWCSSLVWPLHSKHSLPMFAHPLAMQAHANGLGLGYNPQPIVSNHEKDGKVFQRGTGYRYPYQESLIVGLQGVETNDCVLDKYSDWSVTALWKKGADEFRAAFAHGSPYVYFQRQSSQPIEIKFAVAAVNRTEEPVVPIVFELKNINGSHTGDSGQIQLSLNAGNNVGLGSKARLVYDFDGDGKADRVETFNLFAMDPVPETWETYASEKQVIDEKLTHGKTADFKNGSVKLEFWKCFGQGAIQIKLRDCKIRLPIEDGEFFPGKTGQLLKLADDSVVKLVDAEPPAPGKIFYLNENMVGVTVKQSHYAIFAPTGSSWSPEFQVGDTLASITSELHGKNYLSVAVLPDDRVETFKFFAEYAFAFVSDTRVDFQYDPSQASVSTTFTATIEPREGEQTETVFALYPHQYQHLDSPGLTKYRYASPRGEMAVVTGLAFKTTIPFLGVLPALPCPPNAKAELGKMVEEFYDEVAARETPFEKQDTYWNGKELGKFSEVIQIADQVGKRMIRDELLKMLKKQIEGWLAGGVDSMFYYDQTWGVLVGYPDSYGSGDQFNDHHFHYGYFIRAAATIAQFDPAWTKSENYGGMIDLLIRNCANYDRNDSRFVWMRNFDPYAGHSWAAGHAGFASGNNQESSSESMNFATSLILYGEATENKEIRDLGVYWHSSEAEAIRNYWFDNDRVVFPEGYGHSCAAMIWGDGASYGTWWTANPEEIHGINFLPLNGGSLYLGRDPDYVKRNFQNLISSNRNFHNGGFDGDPEKLDRWQDVILQYLALADAELAIQKYAEFEQDPSEFGETKLHTKHWLWSLQHFGNAATEIKCDHPTAIVFQARNGELKYVVFNGTRATKTVTFSDDSRFAVPPGFHVYSN